MPGRNFRAAGHSPRRASPSPRIPRRIGIRQPGKAVFVGPPTIWSNPFQRPGISRARSVILYRAWLAGEMTPGVLRCAHFSEAEIIAMERRLRTIRPQIGELRGRDIRCECPPWEAWCHADVLMRTANPDLAPHFPASASDITAAMVPY